MNSIYLKKEDLKINQNTHKIEINGKKCKNINCYFKQVLSVLGIKYNKKITICDYLDLMCEVSTFKSDDVSFIIYNYKEFLKKDEKIRDLIISTFKFDILPFWEDLDNNDNIKNFNLYLLEENGF
jgi:hypothetical protein